MIRRIFLLLLVLATVLALILYGWKYSAFAGVPDSDPFRLAAEGVQRIAPAQVTTALDTALRETEAAILDVRWVFLAIFFLFYAQLFIGRRRKPRSDKELEVQQRKKSRALATQVKVFFIATLLVAGVIFGIELIARQPGDTLTVLGYQLHRGDAADFRRNVYHYGLLLAVAHLLAYILFTWIALALAARKARRRRPGAAKRPATKGSVGVGNPQTRGEPGAGETDGDRASGGGASPGESSL